MSKKSQLKFRHSSLDLASREDPIKHQDVLSRAKSKLLGLSDALKYRKTDENQNKPLPKSMTQCTLDYFVKHEKKGQKSKQKHPLKKQTSLSSYPQIQISSFDNDLDDVDEVFYPISRLRPATVCVDRPSVDRRSEADALALERPRKKLSFKDPEVTHVDTKHDKPRASKLQNTLKSCEKYLKHPIGGGGKQVENSGDKNFSLGKGIQSMAGLGMTMVASNGVPKGCNVEDDLESQAMRVVRTVGQAFEVCHKLSIHAPEDNYDEEQETTVTQDLLSDRLSDVASDKPKKDHRKLYHRNISSEGANSEKNSLPPDDYSLKDTYLDNSIRRPVHLDILPPPPSNSNSSSCRKSNLESLPIMEEHPPNGVEIIRRVALRKSIAPESYNRVTQPETYASPHSDALTSSGNTGSTATSRPPSGGTLSSHHEMQLLKEQMDQQRQQTQAALAQLQLAREQLQAEQTARMEAQARTHQLLVHNRELLDHIAALVAHLQGGDKGGQQHSPPHMTMPQLPKDPEPPPPQLDPNLVLQALGLTTPVTCQSPLKTTFNPGGGGMFNLPYPPSPLQVDTSFENQLLQRIQAMGSYPSLSPQIPYGYPQYGGYYNPCYPVPYATLPRNYSSSMDSRMNNRHSEPRHIPSMYCNMEKEEYQKPQLSVPTMQRRPSMVNLAQEDETQFIKPLSQVGTLTTTDSEGRVRVIVPAPPSSEEQDTLSNLRISEELRLMNGPGISRSASERVPNRSELMSQVQRSMWARHTTK